MNPLSTAATAFLLLFAFAACTPAGLGPQVAPRPMAALAFVTNQDEGTVSVIDLDRRELSRTVDLRDYGFGPGARPHHVAVEPDGSYWYVSLIGAGRVLKLDRDDRLVGQVEMETPGMLVLHPTEDLLLVGRSMTAVNPPASLGVVRRTDMRHDELGVFFPRPHALAVHPRAGQAYTASLSVDQLAVVDASREEVEVHEVGGEHHMLAHFAISPSGRILLATGEMTGELLVFDLSDPRQPRLERTVPVGELPWHPSFSADGRWAYVPVKGQDEIAVLDAASWEVVDRIRGAGIVEPYGSAVSPDGRTLVVSNSNQSGSYRDADGEPVGTVALIDTATRTVVRVIEVGRNPTGVGVAAPVAVTAAR